MVRTRISTSNLTFGDNVSVQASNGNSCTDQHPGIIVSVSANPVAGLMATQTDICAREVVDFTASGGMIYEFFC